MLCKWRYRYRISWLVRLSIWLLDSRHLFAQLAKITEYGLCEVHIFCYMVIFACCTGDCIGIEYSGWSDFWVIDSRRPFAQHAEITEFGLCKQLFFLCYMVIFACCASDCIGIEYLGWTGWVLDYLVVAVTLCSALRLTEHWLCEEDFFLLYGDPRVLCGERYPYKVSRLVRVSTWILDGHRFHFFIQRKCFSYVI